MSFDVRDIQEYPKAYEKVKVGDFLETKAFLSSEIRMVEVVEGKDGSKCVSIGGHIFRWDYFFEVNFLVAK